MTLTTQCDAMRRWPSERVVLQQEEHTGEAESAETGTGQTNKHRQHSQRVSSGSDNVVDFDSGSFTLHKKHFALC